MGIFNRKQEVGREQEILEHLPKRFRMIARGVARKSAEFLDEDEQILAVFYGNGKDAPAIITAGEFGWNYVEGGMGNYRSAAPPYGEITGVTFGNDELSVVVLDETYTVHTSPNDAEKTAEIIREKVSDYVRLMGDPYAQTEDVEAPAPSISSSKSELQDLADLHAAGILTDEEFTAAKARILGI